MCVKYDTVAAMVTKFVESYIVNCKFLMKVDPKNMKSLKALIPDGGI